MKIYKGLITLILSIWGLPATIAGILIALLLVLFRQIEYAGINTSAKLPFAWALAFEMIPNTWVKKKCGCFGGLTIGNINLFNPDKVKNRPSIKLHELFHSWQNMTGGVFYHIISFYYTQIRRVWLTTQAAYITNPFEKSAYIFSGEKQRYYKLHKKWA